MTGSPSHRLTSLPQSVVPSKSDAEKAKAPAFDLTVMEPKLIDVLNRSLELLRRQRETERELRDSRQEQMKQLQEILALREKLVVREAQVAALSMQRLQEEIDKTTTLEACYSDMGKLHALQLNFLRKLENKYLEFE